MTWTAAASANVTQAIPKRRFGVRFSIRAHLPIRARARVSSRAARDIWSASDTKQPAPEVSGIHRGEKGFRPGKSFLAVEPYFQVLCGIPVPVGAEKMLDRIEHIVVLMLENRSFDNLLG